MNYIMTKKVIRYLIILSVGWINNAQNWTDLRIPPSNRLEKLHGSDFCSIRINDQWRIVFRWIDNNAHDVEIMDYH